MNKNEVDNFIQQLKIEWQQNTCKELIKRTRRSKPKLDEFIKWKNPYFEKNGAVLKWFVAKNWIDIFFYRGYELVEYQDMFREDENGKMRAIKILEDDKINYDRFEEMVKIAVKLNHIK
jgi:hypothetical protein